LAVTGTAEKGGATASAKHIVEELNQTPLIFIDIHPEHQAARQ